MDNWLHYFLMICAAILGPKDAKTSWDGPRQQSKRVKIMKTNDFDNMRFNMFFKALWEQQASPKSPKAAKNPPKTAPDSVQEPLKKEVHLWIQFLAKHIHAKLSKSCRKDFEKHTKN